MVKSKFPGKPSKLVQRTLVSAFSVTVPSCDTSTITENVCYGLSVFENAFGDEEDVSSLLKCASVTVLPRTAGSL